MDALIEQVRRKSGEEYTGVDRCVLAYSGGIDSQVIGDMLSKMGIGVLPVVINAGGSDFEGACANAKKLFGRMKTVDIRPRLKEAAWRAVKTNCIYSGHLNGGGLTRPLMAQAIAEVAHEEGIGAVAHGSSGVGNDHLRMELALRVIGPDLRVLAPVRDWNLKRDEALAYAKRAGWKHSEINQEFSVDESVWARIVRQGKILDPENETPENALKWVSRTSQKEKTVVEVEFLNGIPTRARVAQGKRRAECVKEGMLEFLNREAGMQGIGERDIVVEKVIGLKMRELHECPAASVLVAAHADLDRITLTSSELEAKAWVDRLWNHIVYEGGWFTRLRRDLDAFVDATQSAVDGTVKLSMHNGALRIVGRSSPRAIYDSRLGSRNKSGVMNQKAAAGFARLYGMQDTLAYLLPLE